MPISKEVMMILPAKIKWLKPRCEADVYLKPKLKINLHSKIVIQNQGLIKYSCFSSFQNRCRQSPARGGYKTFMYMNHFMFAHLL